MIWLKVDGVVVFQRWSKFRAQLSCKWVVNSTSLPLVVTCLHSTRNTSKWWNFTRNKSTLFTFSNYSSDRCVVICTANERTINLSHQQSTGHCQVVFGKTAIVEASTEIAHITCSLQFRLTVGRNPFCWIYVAKRHDSSSGLMEWNETHWNNTKKRPDCSIRCWRQICLDECWFADQQTDGSHVVHNFTLLDPCRYKPQALLITIRT